ncbi:MAG: hypothetical protein JNL10_17510 [Verrucomicrobiales bacterium]|nr:hypothetical protein [Verrucomicrobiales bacterium]
MLRSIMTETASIDSTVGQTARRLRWLRGWSGLWKGALAGAGIYLLALITYKLAPVPDLVVSIAGWAALGATGVGFFAGFWRRIPFSEAARWLDEREGLQQRLATALEVSRQPSGTAWKDLVMSDASAAAARIQPARLLPVGLPRIARSLMLVLALIVGLGFVPEFRSKAHVQKQADAAVIREVGRQLALVTRKSIEQRPPNAEPVRRKLEDVQELGQRLTQAKLTRDDALKDLAKTTEQLRQQAADLAKNPALKRMEQAARNPGGRSPANQAQLQKQMDALKQQMGDKAGSPDAADQLKKDLDKLKDAAKGMAENPSGATDAMKQQLSSMASELARKAESLGMPMPSLDEAAAALQASQVDQFLKDLNVADRDLEKMADLARQMAQLQQQAQKLGKDLAEQLQNGEAQAAADTLQRMQDLMKNPQLTPEQLAQLQEELGRSVKPGEQYGKVGEKLAKALKQSKAGSTQDARQSLAEAKKELEDLMKEMGDLEGLMASLQQLQKAQACVGNCQAWGSQPARYIRAGNSGRRGGKGVGTWSESDPWSLPDHLDELWDNSGLNRPDRDPKGQTERDTDIAGNLAPTKIKGQMQPGGPMPSITLKGLSIKGESKVAYTEAVTAAQSEAQSALNQEQVPKAYRGAVRDYFDDLK